MHRNKKGIAQSFKIPFLSVFERSEPDLSDVPKQINGLVRSAAILMSKEVTAIDNLGEEMDETIRLSVFSNGTVFIEGNHGLARSAVLDAYKESITSLVISEGIYRIPEFHAYPVIRKVIFPSTLYALGTGAFQDCTALKEVDLRYVEQIGSAAFKNCFSLVHVDFPPSQLVIEDQAFEHCTCLKQVIIPCVDVVSYDAFKGCVQLTSLEIYGNRDLYSPIIYGGAFSDCGSLRKVKLHHIESIDRNSFQNCVRLRKIELDRMCPIIYQNAFKGCESLKEVCFPDDFTYIPGTDIGLGIDCHGRRIPGFTIKGRYGSMAHAYAKEKRIRFKLM